MLEEKEKSILAQKNLSEQTKGFLPSVIYKRILNMHNNEGSSVVEATDEVLRAKKKNIVCLFSDIRNYTNSTKNIDNFLDRSAIPNIKLITSITDKNNGISRLIGDLVLAYFDDESFEKKYYPIVLKCNLNMYRKQCL